MKFRLKVQPFKLYQKVSGYTLQLLINSDIIKEEEKCKIHSVYNKYSNSCIQSIAVHPILNNLNKINSNSPGSDGYIKEELCYFFMVN